MPQYQCMKRLALSALLILTSSSSLLATNISLTGFDLDRAMGLAFNLDGEEHVAGAGIMLLSVDGADPVQSLCANLFEGLSFYETYAANSVTALSYDEHGGAAGWLLQAYLPTIQTGVEGAALQLAVWDVIHDGGDGFDAGRIQSNSYTDPDVLDLSRQWAESARGQSSTAAYVFTPPPGCTAFQQQIYLAADAGDGGPTGDVPEPGSLALVVAGGLAIAIGAKRK